MPASARHECVSVVMPVHNAMPHLDAAVQSILDQSYSDFEFVIYDDASTDGSRERLREWAGRDSRIRLFEGERNLGPVGSSALVVAHSTQELVARMDADDICAAGRLEQQVEVLHGAPRAGVVGSLFDIIDEDGRLIRGPDYWRLTMDSGFVPFAHGASMFRRSVFEQVGGYRPECEFWEDQDLIVRIAAVAEVLVIPSPLYEVRQWTRNTRVASDSKRVEDAVDLMYRCVARLQSGRSYDDLLADAAPRTRIDPRVFISAGSLILWAGKRPLLFSRLLKRGKLRLDMRSLSALVWTGWAALSPGSLRAFLTLLIKARNARAPFLHEGPVRWQPFRAVRRQAATGGPEPNARVGP